MKTWYALTPHAEKQETEISIFDEIGFWGVTAKDFIDDLKEVPAAHKIVLRIHSPGGEVFDGNAIATAIRRRGNVEVQIEGLAASMATVISLAGAPVKMAANGFYMIHNPWGMAIGDAEELRDQAELLDKIRSTMVSAYAGKSGQSAEQIIEWMDAETWFTAEQALDAGFVDEITEGFAAAASANRFERLSKFRNAPAALINPTATMPKKQKANSDIAPEATVVSESAPAEQPATEVVETPATEPAPSEAPAEDQTPEPPAEPQAKANTAADAILAKYNSAIAERDAALAEVQAYSAKFETLRAELDHARAEIATEREALARLESSLGLSAARTVPVIEDAQHEDTRAALLDALNATADPIERNRIARRLREI